MRAAIVIFGAAVRPDGRPSGAMLGRVQAALALGRTLPSPLYMPTGGQGRWGDQPEAELMAALLRNGGVPADAIRPEPTGRNTVRSARACAALLRGERAGPVYVATSSYHMRRCVTLLRAMGVDARRGAAPPGPASRRWWRQLYWHGRELPALPVDLAVALFWRLRRQS